LQIKLTLVLADAGNTVAVRLMLKLSHADVVVTGLTEGKLDESVLNLNIFL
jgi:hypothetical protein